MHLVVTLVVIYYGVTTTTRGAPRGILNVAAFVGAIPSTSLPLVKAYNYHVNTIIKYDFGLKFHSLNLCKT